MGYAKTRKKYGYPDSLSDQDVVLQTRARPEFSHVTNEDFASGLDQYEGLAGASQSPVKGTPASSAPAMRLPALPGVLAPISQGVNAAATISEEGGLPFIAGTPKRALDEGWEMLKGLGPLASGVMHAASLGPRMAVRDPTAMPEALQAGRAIGRAAPDVLKELLGTMKEEGEDPIGSFLKRPVTTGLDALAAAEAPALLLRGAAGAASRIGAKGFAKGAMRAGEAVAPQAVAGRALESAEQGIPAVGNFMRRRREIGDTRFTLAQETKPGARQAVQRSDEIAAATRGLRPDELEAILPVAEGTASIAPKPMRQPSLIERLISDKPRHEDRLPVPADKAKMEKALGAYKGRVGEMTAEDIARGELTPEIAELRRFQPLRMATSGAEQLANEAAPRTAKNMKWLSAQTSEIKSAMPDADPTYVPGLAPRGERLKEMFLKMIPKPISAGTPGYSKQSSGARLLSGERDKNLAKVWARQEQARIAYHTRDRQLQAIANKPYARAVQSEKEVDWANEALVDLDAFAKAGDGANVVGAALKSANPQQAIAQAAQGAVKTAATGTKGQRLVAVPKHVAKEMAGQFGADKGVHPLIRAVFDTPNSYLRWTALTLRPGFYVNNLVGNTALAGLSGASAEGALDAARSKIPATVRGSGQLGVEAPGASLTLGKLGKVGKIPHLANEAVDDAMRHVSFRSEVHRQAMRKQIMDTGERLRKGMTAAEKEVLLGPEGVERALKHTNRWMNDYTIQSPAQKRILRRLLPFQSFLVHMGKLVTGLPAHHPMRANLLAQMSTLANEYQDEQWREVGVEPENVASYRKHLLPIRKDEDGRITTISGGGFNPASGVSSGAEEADQALPLRSLIQTFANQSGVSTKLGLDALMATLGGTATRGWAYTKPGVTNKWGTDEFKNEEGEEVGAPIPGPVDAVRQNTPFLKILEALAQPKETYDLVGSPFPWSKNYLPAKKDEPRKYSAKEMLASYLGVPLRDFEEEEVRKRR